MRDFRDAKIMAQTLRDQLTVKSLTLSHSESLELTSKMLGLNDWNTLSALLKTERDPPARKSSITATTYPAIPVRDFVPLPTMTFPLFVGREKTMLALDHAFERQREVVVVAQSHPSIENPGFAEIYKTGILAGLLDIRRLPDGHEFKGRKIQGVKITLQAYRRVSIRNFTGQDGAYLAETTDISEGKIPEAPQLIEKTAARFEAHAATHKLDIQHLGTLAQIHDPGRLADLIAGCLRLPFTDSQSLLETLDPITRLEKTATFLDNLP